MGRITPLGLGGEVDSQGLTAEKGPDTGSIAIKQQMCHGAVSGQEDQSEEGGY